MKLILSDRDSMKIEYCKSILDEYGINSQTKNILLSPLAGPLPSAQVWPELWVLDEDYDKALKILEKMVQS